MNATTATLTLIITSAATASIVSGVFTLLHGKWERDSKAKQSEAERTARKKELLIREALSLAEWRIESTRAAIPAGMPVQLPDKIVVAETYYEFLRHLWDHDVLPDDARIDRTLI